MQDGILGSIVVGGEQCFAEEEEVYAVCQADDGKDYRVVLVNGVKYWQVIADVEYCVHATTVVALLSKPIHKIAALDTTNTEGAKKGRGRPKKETLDVVKQIIKNDEPKKTVIKKIPVLVTFESNTLKKKVVIKKVL